MKLIHLLALIIVAVSLVFASDQHNLRLFVLYGVWISGFLFGLGLYECLKKFKACTKNSN